MNKHIRSGYYEEYSKHNDSSFIYAFITAILVSLAILAYLGISPVQALNILISAF
jgi:hypothetical protein